MNANSPQVAFWARHMKKTLGREVSLGEALFDIQKSQGEKGGILNDLMELQIECDEINVMRSGPNQEARMEAVLIKIRHLDLGSRRDMRSIMADLEAIQK